MARCRAEILIVLHGKARLGQLHVHFGNGIKQGFFRDNALAFQAQFGVNVFLTYIHIHLQYIFNVLADDVAHQPFLGAKEKVVEAVVFKRQV